MADPRPLDEKIAAYRQKFPDRVAALQAVLLPLLGIHSRTKLSPEAVAETVRPTVDRCIAVVWGLDP